MIHFNNDYMRGAHPLILQRLLQTNMEQSVGYGLDEYCSSAEKKILKECNLTNGKVYFLVGGTQTNAVMIDAMLIQCQGVIASVNSHINVHEAGAIEASGHKVITLDDKDGKLQADDIKNYLDNFYGDPTWQHMVIPGMVYLSQPTEFGTIYSKDELIAISKVCKDFNLKLYVDGARLLYALAAEGNDVSLADLSMLCDAFYIGGTKAGALFGEAVVITEPDKYAHLFTLIKRHGALLAKGRLLGVQYDTLFSDALYKEIGTSAVKCAMLLKNALLAQGWQPLVNSPTNQQIFIIPNEKLDRLSQQVSFDIWGKLGAAATTVRFVTDWSTSFSEIQALISIINSL